MIKRLRWDTDFFGFPVAKLTIVEKDIDDIDEKINSSLKPYKLLYIFSDYPLPCKFDKDLIDKKVTYEKKINQSEREFLTFQFDYSRDSFTELLKLVYLSGTYSRFKRDDNFVKEDFYKLYRQWIYNSISDKNTYVLITKENGFISGFITVTIDENLTANIGLISVNENFRGKGIGNILLKDAEKISANYAANKIQVATQKINKPAMKLYNKNNYTIKHIKYIYHLWNK